MPAYGEYSADELMRMTIDGISYDKEADIARVQGVGKITVSGVIGREYARRAAVSDAQRAFLILKRGINEGGEKPFRADSVSGHVPPFRIVSEDIKDGVYFVYAETSLSELMGTREFRRAFVLPDNEEEDAHDEDSKDYSVPITDSLDNK